MPRRIEEDHKDFLDVYSGKLRKELKKFINNGKIFRQRGKNGKIDITIPKIDIPHIVYGEPQEGVGRGKGEPGDVIGRDDGKGSGNKAGEGHKDGVTISVDMEDVLNFLQHELKLPDLKSKPNNIFDEVKIKYNDISLTGPESLRHNRKTMLQALKRMAATGELDKLHYIPGHNDPMRLITPINSDKRYRQYKEIKIPASNAVIFFARDGSASMDDRKCNIVSDMSWWIDCWIRKFYKRVERCYVWHDTLAEEVSEEDFYRYRYGGGTKCSSAMKYIAKQFKNRFKPDKWNIYIFYFTDGDNWADDNQDFSKIIRREFTTEVVNFFGLTQILCYGGYDGSLRQYVDNNISSNNFKTTEISASDSSSGATGWYGSSTVSEEDLAEQIRNSIIDLLGVEQGQKNE